VSENDVSSMGSAVGGGGGGGDLEDMMRRDVNYCVECKERRENRIKEVMA
jgi:hypothetical protein